MRTRQLHAAANVLSTSGDGDSVGEVSYACRVAPPVLFCILIPVVRRKQALQHGLDLVKQAAASVEAMRSAEPDVGQHEPGSSASQSTDALTSRIQDLTQSERMLSTELGVARDAYDKSRAQYMAAEVEIKMLRSHLDSLKVRALELLVPVNRLGGH